MKFEWDGTKNEANSIKHGVDFETAARIFESFVLTIVDSRKDYGEVRRISIGEVDNVAILVVVHTDRQGVTRIISARPASKHERSRYEEALRSTNDG